MIIGRILNQIVVSFRLCAMEIWSNRLRTIITTFGIFLGVTSFLVNVAFIRGIDLDIKKNMDEIGGLKIITVKKKQSSTEEEEMRFDNSVGIDPDEIEEVAKTLPYVKCTLPVIDIQWSPAQASGRNTYVKPFAVSPEYMNAYNYEVREGRLLTSDDHLQKRDVCLIGSRIIQELFPFDKSVIGKSITILNHEFTIAGVIKTDDQYSYKAIQILFPYSFYIYKFGNGRQSLDEVPVELVNSDYSDKACIEITRLLKEKHRGLEDFTVESNQSKIEEMRSASLGLKVLMSTISIITLLMGGISIMNIMFAAIGDRIREIGVRKALGARQSDIFLQFIIEATAVSFVGGLPGLALGTVILLFPKGFFPFNPALTGGDFMTAIMFTLVVGIISGLSPAFRAASMQPVEALRY